MHPNLFPKTHIVKILLLLLVVLTSCGTQNQPTTSLNSTPTSNSSSSTTSNLSDKLSLNNTGISIDKANLHIDVAAGVECPMDVLTTGRPDNPGLPVSPRIIGNNLVLATNRLSYDSNELQQMRNYLKSIFFSQSGPTQMPDTLRWVLGGPTGTSRAVIYADGKLDGYIDDCGFKLELTNIGQNAIQIQSVGVQLMGGTQQNNYQYRLIDICGGNVLIIACGFGGGGSVCSEYYATIKLGVGSTNAVFSAMPVAGDPSCGELTLNPRESKELYVYLYSPHNLIYLVRPQLTLDTSNGSNTLPLTELTSRLAFANDNQFRCYALQGDTFVEEARCQS